MQPLVSIILPVYNSEQFIKKTIDSILSQTYTNYELLIINDGSKDSSASIINEFTDDRIKYFYFETNKGLITVLNYGLTIAKGKYIARIDADDICLNTRIEKQVNWLEKNITTAIVATQISCINEVDEPTNNWQLDLETITAKDIKNKMAWECCIAHPSVMMRSEIVKKYRYSSYQRNTEDYDLWLQILSDGYSIEKIPEQLLQYRVHNQSVTGNFHRKKNPFIINATTKRKFLIHRIKKLTLNFFELVVFFTMVHDILLGLGKEIKKLFKI